MTWDEKDWATPLVLPKLVKVLRGKIKYAHFLVNWNYVKQVERC